MHINVYSYVCTFIQCLSNENRIVNVRPVRKSFHKNDDHFTACLLDGGACCVKFGHGNEEEEHKF